MGVIIETIKPGDNRTFPKKGQTVVARYTGTLASNGKKFASSRDGNKAFEFRIGMEKMLIFDAGDNDQCDVLVV